MASHDDSKLDPLDQELYDLVDPGAHEGPDDGPDDGSDEMAIDPTLEDPPEDNILQPASLTAEGAIGRDLIDVDNTSDTSDHTAEPQSKIPDIRADPDTVPDSFTARMHKIPNLRAQFLAYYNGYSYADEPMESHLERAKRLAHALLKHYYPSCQGFSVEPTSLDDMARHGWTIEEKQVEYLVARGNKKKKKKLHTVKAEPTYHTIPKDHIAGFVVKKQYVVDQGYGTEANVNIPHTYLAIMVDDLTKMGRWQSMRQADVHRGDILTYSLGVQAKVQRGPGILIVGNYIEFYQYNNAGPRSLFMSPYAKEHWSLPMDESNIILVNQMFEAVAMTDIAYQDGMVGEGVRKEPSTLL